MIRKDDYNPGNPVSGLAVCSVAVCDDDCDDVCFFLINFILANRIFFQSSPSSWIFSSLIR